MRALLFLLTALTVTAAQALEVERTAFQQSKFLPHLSRPLQSRGELVRIKEAGLLYRLEAPVQAAYLMGKEALVIDEAGQKKRLEPDKAPWLKAMAAILPALIGGDLTALRQQFEVEEKKLDNGFEWRCVPRAPAFRQALPEIILRGHTHVESVQYKEANGARTELALSAPTPGETTAYENELLAALKP